ncbi:MAG: sugar transferase [Chloroflexota bacterium]
MIQRFSVNFMIFLMGLDFCLVAINLVIANLIRPQLNLPFSIEITTPLALPVPLFILFPMVWVAILMWATVYDYQRNYHVADEMTNLLFGSLLASISLAGMLYLSYREVSRLLFLLFATSTYVMMVFWRLIIRLLLRFGFFVNSKNRRMLIVGAGELGRTLQSKIVGNTDLDIAVAGFLEDDELLRQSAQQEILGRLSDLRQIVNQYNIDDVVLALPLGAHERINSLVAESHELPVKLWVIPSYFTLALFKADVVDYAGILMLDLRAPALSEYQRITKRIFDIVVTLISFPFILPVMGIIAIFIYFDSPGFVIFRQKRVGENGKPFIMYKFRTMVSGAEGMRSIVECKDKDGNLIHKVRNDPRVTRIGKLLRLTSLDELPQLFNVIKGDMSLVGPRPELPYLVDQYKTWQRKRFAVPQGITGWWQINGRSDRPMHLHTEDDLFYVQNYSIWLDLQILFKTFWVALSRKGAY